MRQHVRRGILAITGISALASVVACVSTTPPAPTARIVEPLPVSAVATEPRTMRVDVTFGGVVVVPIGPVLDPLLARRPTTLTLDNGDAVGVNWRWAEIELDPAPDAPGSADSPGARHARAWLGPTQRWTTRDAPGENPTGLWLAVLTMPRECDGRSLRLGVRTLQLHTLQPSSRLMAPPPGGAWRHPAISSGDPMLAAAAGVPTKRWWARLLSDGMRTRIARVGPGIDPARDAAAQAPPDTDRFNDPVLEAWATQQEERWRWALDALAVDDRALAESLVASLVQMPRLDNVAVPLALFEDPKLESLRDLLLDPRRDARDRRGAAQAWLENQPVSLAWVTDDAGALVPPKDVDESSKATVGVALANLTPAPVLGWVGRLEDQTAQDASQVLTRVEPLASETVRVLCDMENARDLPPGQYPPPARLAAHIGDDIVMVDVFASPVAVRPPGFAIPGLVADWSAASLVSAAREGVLASPVDSRTRGLVDRDENNRWTLTLDVADVATSEQVVRLWLGPRHDDQTPSAEARLRPAGLEPLVMSESGVEIVASASARGWVLRFVIPPQLIEPPGILRMAIERIGPGGRVSWPRPMLPWQMEPGRFALDLGAWDQVGRGR